MGARRGQFAVGGSELKSRRSIPRLTPNERFEILCRCLDLKTEEGCLVASKVISLLPEDNLLWRVRGELDWMVEAMLIRRGAALTDESGSAVP